MWLQGIQIRPLKSQPLTAQSLSPAPRKIVFKPLYLALSSEPNYTSLAKKGRSTFKYQAHFPKCLSLFAQTQQINSKGISLNSSLSTSPQVQRKK